MKRKSVYYYYYYPHQWFIQAYSSYNKGRDVTTFCSAPFITNPPAYNKPKGQDKREKIQRGGPLYRHVAYTIPVVVASRFAYQMNGTKENSSSCLPSFLPPHFFCPCENAFTSSSSSSSFLSSPMPIYIFFNFLMTRTAAAIVEFFPLAYITGTKHSMSQFSAQ